MVQQKTSQELRRFINEGGLQKVLDNKGEYEAAKILVDTLWNHGIRWIATDFDMTMTTVHSHGPVLLGSELHRNVVTSLSSAFNHFATYASQKGMKICIVTFNEKGVIALRTQLPDVESNVSLTEELDDTAFLAGEQLIQETMEKSNATFSIERIYAYFPPLYAEKPYYETLGLTEPMHLSKSFHLYSMCRDFNISRNSIVFLDDDMTNCVQAVKEGYLTIHAAFERGFHFSTVRLL